MNKVAYSISAGLAKFGCRVTKLGNIISKLKIQSKTFKVSVQGVVALGGVL